MLEQLVSWCHHGPPAAQVEQVKVRYAAATDEFTEFTVRREPISGLFPGAKDDGST